MKKVDSTNWILGKTQCSPALADVWFCWRGAGGSAGPLWHRVGSLTQQLRSFNQCLASNHRLLQTTPNCLQLMDCHQTWSWPSTFVQCADLKKSLFILTTVATARWCSILSCNDNKYRNNVTLYLLKGKRIHKFKSTLNIRTQRLVCGWFHSSQGKNENWPKHSKIFFQDKGEIQKI